MDALKCGIWLRRDGALRIATPQIRTLAGWTADSTLLYRVDRPNHMSRGATPNHPGVCQSISFNYKVHFGLNGISKQSIMLRGRAHLNLRSSNVCVSFCFNVVFIIYAKCQVRIGGCFWCSLHAQVESLSDETMQIYDQKVKKERKIKKKL